MGLPLSMVIGRFLEKELNHTNLGLYPYHRYLYGRAIESIKGKSNEEIRSAIDKTSKLYGFGDYLLDKVQNFLNDIQAFETVQDELMRMIKAKPKYVKIDRNIALVKANELITYLESHKIKYTICGSYRRGCKEVGNLNIVMEGAMPDRSDLIELGFINDYGNVCTEITIKGLTVYLYAVHPDEYWYQVEYWTGPELHNKRMANLAKSLKYELTKHGLYVNGKRFMFTPERESDIYQYLGHEYILPENR